MECSWTPFASFRFIGAAGNNFSTFFETAIRASVAGCSRPVLTQRKWCPSPRHSLFHCAPAVASVRDSDMALFAGCPAPFACCGAQPLRRLCFLPQGWEGPNQITPSEISLRFFLRCSSPDKNRRQEDRPLPPPVLTATVFALCLKLFGVSNPVIAGYRKAEPGTAVPDRLAFVSIAASSADARRETAGSASIGPA
jgi:hypothetical protein